MTQISKPYIGPEEKQAVLDVLESGMLAQGPRVAEFEKQFAELCGTKYAVALNSGTAAIHAALYALGVKPGDEVITVPFTFVATANPIIMLGAKPVFVDIEEETFNIDPDKVERAITPKTKVIVAVSLYGHPYDSKRINEIARKHKIKVLEDACQSVFAKDAGKHSGNLSEAAAFSFYATKNMMTGEGGMVTTNDANIAELTKRFRHHGQSEQTRYEYFDLGYNYRMTDLQAAIGLCQLKRVKEWAKQRQANADALTKGLAGTKGIITPKTRPDATHVFHQYTIRVTKDYPLARSQLAEKLKANGIGTGIYYPKPLHLHEAFKRYGHGEGSFPVAEKASAEVLSIPVHPFVTGDDINEIIRIIREA